MTVPTELNTIDMQMFMVLLPSIGTLLQQFWGKQFHLSLSFALNKSLQQKEQTVQTVTNFDHVISFEVMLRDFELILSFTLLPKDLGVSAVVVNSFLEVMLTTQMFFSRVVLWSTEGPGLGKIH